MTTELIVKDEDAMTSAQIARALNITESGVNQNIAAWSLAPVGEQKAANNKMAKLYSLKAYSSKQVEQQQQLLLSRKQEKAEALVAKDKMLAGQVVLEAGKQMSAEETIMAAGYFVQMLNAKVEELRATSKEALILIEKHDQWYTIRRMSKVCKEDLSKADWRALKKASFELGYDVKKVTDPLYGEVNSYHRDAWIQVYPLTEQFI